MCIPIIPIPVSLYLYPYTCIPIPVSLNLHPYPAGRTHTALVVLRSRAGLQWSDGRACMVRRSRAHAPVGPADPR